MVAILANRYHKKWKELCVKNTLINTAIIKKTYPNLLGISLYYQF